MSEQDWRHGRNWFTWLPPTFGYSALQDPPSPYKHSRVWIMRDGWEEIRDVNPRDIPPTTNAIGLYWSPWDGQSVSTTMKMTNHPSTPKDAA